MLVTVCIGVRRGGRRAQTMGMRLGDASFIIRAPARVRQQVCRHRGEAALSFVS